MFNLKTKYMTVEVLCGTACCSKTCALFQNVQEVAAELYLNADIIYTSDLQKRSRFGKTVDAGIVIDGKLVVDHSISKDEIKALLQK